MPDIYESKPTEKPTECGSCEFTTTELEFYDRRGTHAHGWWLCKLCSSTFISNLIQYGHYDAATKSLAQSIAYIGNTILSEVRRA